MLFLFYNRLNLLVIAAIGIGVLSSPAVGHPGQHLGLKITIGDEEVTYDIILSAELRNTIIPLDYSSFEYDRKSRQFQFIDPEEKVLARTAFEQFFKDNNAVMIDSVQVLPILKELTFVPYTVPGVPFDAYPPDVHIVLSYSTKGPPKQVAMIWDLYPQDPSRAPFGLDPAVEVVAELDAYDENKMIVFLVDEPEVVWHAGGKPIRRKVTPIVAKVKPATIPVPLLSLGFVALWAVSLLGLRFVPRRRQVIRQRALLLSIAPLAAALLTHNVLVKQVVVPWGMTARLPSEQEARELFTALHRNVYRAFDYKSESDIYDVLAQSVDGDLLDQVYNEVYQNLIMRDQGGAVARVQSVDVLEVDIESSGVVSDSSVVAFQVRTRWQVHGAVYHWGHVHSRTNEYKALYTVAQRADKWKITAVTDVEQRRIVKEGDDPPLETRDPSSGEF